MRPKKYVSLIIIFSFQSIMAQSDSLVFSGKNIITGEIKKMEIGVLEIDVPYDDDNFKIKWLSVKEIYTKSKFTISTGKKIYEGRLASVSENKVKIFDSDSIYLTCNLDDIVYFTQFKDKFKDRFDALVELGFNFTKAQNLAQFSSRSSIRYKTNKSKYEVSYNFIRSSQSDAETIKRSDGLLNYNRILFRKWYLTGSLSTLANTEQRIDIRANTQVGIGNYIYSTNRAYWGVKLGVNNNLEKFENESDSRNSWEGIVGTELNIYDVGDLDLRLIFTGFSSFTDSGRYRADATFDVKYDLPLDFFIRTGISFNYDNQPALDASSSDYVIRSGIGWEW